ncbi:hypothetical protein SCHPADRAFT_525531 [Schizopora paradoxa]|uniref:Uncharacterized protein n=1 Tax=Schizopora paradoxa TaxID=27342 RepID=A0A0H2REJ7_9AGAM|nr:hypothetical protein SCHPADRAFT_525531 [Schizopora paradoxa]
MNVRSNTTFVSWLCAATYRHIPLRLARHLLHFDDAAHNFGLQNVRGHESRKAPAQRISSNLRGRFNMASRRDDATLGRSNRRWADRRLSQIPPTHRLSSHSITNEAERRVKTSASPRSIPLAICSRERIDEGRRDDRGAHLVSFGTRDIVTVDEVLSGHGES